MSFWRKYTAIFSRLRFLEEREAEITAALIEIRKDQVKTANGLMEMERILPPLRSALTTFSEFNKTY